jgi:hypothetical protein
MVGARHFALAAALVAFMPAARLHAQFGPPSRYGQSTYGQTAYNNGYQRGQYLGEQDARRGRPFNYSADAEFRRGNHGYQSQYGSRDRYREDFQLGFENDYRAGYSRYVPGGGPEYSRGRGNGYGVYGPEGRYGISRSDLANVNGYRDGYEEGLNDGRKRHTNDPYDESRYHNGDRGYEREYGAREIYRSNYRVAFVDGYEAGYQAGWRYR